MNRNCLDDPTGGENMSFSTNGMPAQNWAEYDAPAKQALEPVVRLFGGKVSAVFVERDSAAIPAPLRNPFISTGSTRQSALPLIGIECGSASAGLGGAVFQNQAAADAYLKDNPVLRNTLIELAAARQVVEGQQTKTEMIYHYLTGPRFKQRVEAIVEAFSSMKEDLDKEKKAITKQWAKREEQIDRVMQGTVGMYGDLQGIAGKTLQEIEGLEMKALESGETGDEKE